MEAYQLAMYQELQPAQIDPWLGQPTLPTDPYHVVLLCIHKQS
jgi:hypothetical protein